ncbi:MAG: antibiotic biosynthesis monooxygenase [Porticoccaceae bacterium]|nr:antibiotic biosynthesis monooxygenase [Porticoccaceae bacterium]|tara:strand:- start:1243 stop:1542 length:300 start_codon:yes stop_codon:yes gene_type:complete
MLEGEMIAVTAKLNVKSGCEAQFEKAMLDLVEKVNTNEPGNLLYKLCKDSGGNYLVMELYENEAAVDEHRKAEHVKASGPSFKGIMGGPPEITRMEVIG